MQGIYKGMLKKRRTYKTEKINAFTWYVNGIASPKDCGNRTNFIKNTPVLCFILQTNFAARRTFVRLRVNKIKYEALILPGLSVPHLLFLSTKKGAASQKCSPIFLLNVILFPFTGVLFPNCRVS